MKQARKTTYLFDLDGTLLDTLEDLVHSVRHMTEIHGYPERSREEVRNALGNGAFRLLRDSFPTEVPDETVREYLKEYLPYYEAHCAEKTRPFDGVDALLNALQERGCRIGILSNKPDGSTKVLCSHWFPGIYAQGQTEQLRRKPAPDMVLHLMERWHCTREETVYIGDSEVDLETARNAGIDSIAVTWGFRDLPQLKEAGAEHLVDAPMEILEVFPYGKE